MSQCHGDMATDPATVSATARTSWNARTKERSRARFLIRQRLQASVNASYSASASADEPSNHIECLDVGEASTALVGAAATTKTQGGSIIISSYTTDAIDRAAERDMRLGCLGAVESGSVAKFSLRYMEMHRDVLRRPIPPEDFAAAARRTRIYETCTSRFGSKALNYTDGRRHADAVQAYLSDGRVCVTALQYAALLGEHDVLKALLLERSHERAEPCPVSYPAAASSLCECVILGVSIGRRAVQSYRMFRCGRGLNRVGWRRSNYKDAGGIHHNLLIYHGRHRSGSRAGYEAGMPWRCGVWVGREILPPLHGDAQGRSPTAHTSGGLRGRCKTNEDLRDLHIALRVEGT